MSKIIALSGAFDPPTIGQTEMISHAAKLGDVIIILNSDDWLAKRKHHIFLSREKRKEILLSMPGVIDVVDAKDEDGTVCQTLTEIRPDMFGNGGPRTPDNTPELELCKKLNIELVWRVGSVENNKQVEELYARVVNGKEKE